MNTENQSPWDSFRILCYNLGHAHQRALRAQKDRVIANDNLITDLKLLALSSDVDEDVISNSNEALKKAIVSFDTLKQNFAMEVTAKKQELDIIEELKPFFKKPPTT